MRITGGWRTADRLRGLVMPRWDPNSRGALRATGSAPSGEASSPKRLGKGLPMSGPVCAKCDHDTFKLTSIEPEGAKYRLCLVHCKNCGAPAGLTEADNVPVLIRESEQRMKDFVEAAVSAVLGQIEDVEKRLTDRLPQ